MKDVVIQLTCPSCGEKFRKLIPEPPLGEALHVKCVACDTPVEIQGAILLPASTKLEVFGKEGDFVGVIRDDSPDYVCLFDYGDEEYHTSLTAELDGDGDVRVEETDTRYGQDNYRSVLETYLRIAARDIGLLAAALGGNEQDSIIELLAGTCAHKDLNFLVGLLEEHGVPYSRYPIWVEG